MDALKRDYNKIRRTKRHRKTNAMVRKAVQQGKLKKKPCCICGKGYVLAWDKVVGHHENYRKPLDVIWLCYLHHQRLHRKPDRMIEA